MSLTASSPFYRPLDIKAPYFNFLNIFLPSKCFPDSSVGKESAFNAGDHSSTLGSGRSSGEGKGYPLQYCGLENSMDCIELQSSMDCI